MKTNNDIKESIVRFKQNSRNNWYANPTKPIHHIAKTAIQLLDPTGISSYGDLSDAIDLQKANPSGINTLNLILNGFSALPIIGKVPKAIKIIKGLRILDKSSEALSAINKAIDSVPELIPGIRQATQKIQDFTAIPANKFLNTSKSRFKYNIGVDLVNATNTGTDFYGGINPFIEKKQKGGVLYLSKFK